MPIQALSPTRVDLAGGTLDISPLTQILQHKKTVNFGVSLFAGVRLSLARDRFSIRSIDQNLDFKASWSDIGKQTHLPWVEKILWHFWSKELPPIEVEIEAKSPAGAGLGGSSCLGIALASGLLQARAELGRPLILSEQALVQNVQDLETSLIKVPTGCQDYWGGLRGGINIISYPAGGIHIETLGSDGAEKLSELLILCFSGVSRASGTNNWAIFKKAFDGDTNTLAILNEIGRVSEDLAISIRNHDWQEVFRLSAAEWQLRTRLWGDIETTETKAMTLAAQQAGAAFTRICGAGGGGVMAVFALPDRHRAVRQSLEAVGGKILDGNVSFSPTTVKGTLL